MKKILILFTAILLLSAAVIAEELTVQSDKQEFVDKENKIKLEGNVKVKYGDINLASPRAEVNIDEKTQKIKDVKFVDNAYSYRVNGAKKQEIKANIIKMSVLDKIIYAEENSQTTVTDNGKPLVIVTADNQQFNKTTSTMHANGSVIIMYKDIESFSDKAVLELDSKNDIKKIQLIGNSILKQKDNTIKANHLVYDNRTEQATGTGNVYTDIMVEGKDRLQVWSETQFYDKKRNYVTASGSTRVEYKDFIATGPKASVFPSKSTNKMNEVLFSGRSKIQNGARTIVADKITLTLNPKDFKAEGNVKTTISNLKGFD
ncbi:hypothetical protein IKQ26_06295 [bacterium]|nr:hypothetical protein [bacterium]